MSAILFCAFWIAVFFSIGVMATYEDRQKRQLQNDDEQQLRYITGLELATEIIDEAEAVSILAPYGGSSSFSAPDLDVIVR